MIRKLRWQFVAVCMGLVRRCSRRCSRRLSRVRQNIEDLSRQMLYQVLREDSGGRCAHPHREIGGDRCCCLISQ